MVRVSWILLISRHFFFHNCARLKYIYNNYKWKTNNIIALINIDYMFPKFVHVPRVQIWKFRNNHNCSSKPSTYLLFFNLNFINVFSRDYILRITRKINNCIPDMCKMLQEHKSRQNVFYNCYDSQLRMCVILRKPNPTSTTDAEFLRLFDRLHEVVEDKNPWTVLNKVKNRYDLCMIFFKGYTVSELYL